MKIIRYDSGDGTTRVGVQVNEKVVDLNIADPNIPADLLALIEAGERGLDLVRNVVSRSDSVREEAVRNLGDVKIVAPWPGRRIAMAGGNYARHVLGAVRDDPQGKSLTLEEMAAMIRNDGPWGFWKTLAWVTNPGDPLPYPRRTQHLDYEGEVGIVLSKRGKDIRAEEIDKYIWGVTLLNDWSDRDDETEPRVISYNLHKNFDGSLTIGPCIVVDELDPQDIDVETRVNGDVRQRYNTKEMVLGFGEIAAGLSRDLTLVPGDILGGGTGAGTAADIVGLAHKDEAESAKWFLRPGDTVEVSSPQIGAFHNEVTEQAGRPA